jgi:hypothetical protein
LFLNSDTLFVTFHYNDMILKCQTWKIIIP